MPNLRTPILTFVDQAVLAAVVDSPGVYSRWGSDNSFREDDIKQMVRVHKGINVSSISVRRSIARLTTLGLLKQRIHGKKTRRAPTYRPTRAGVKARP